MDTFCARLWLSTCLALAACDDDSSLRDAADATAPGSSADARALVNDARWDDGASTIDGAWSSAGGRDGADAAASGGGEHGDDGGAAGTTDGAVPTCTPATAEPEGGLDGAPPPRDPDLATAVVVFPPPV